MIVDLNAAPGKPEEGQAPPDLRYLPRKRHQDAPQLDRLPPHSLESEQSVLGAILCEPRAFLELVDKPDIADAFYDLRHQTLFHTFRSLYETGVAIDLITVHNQLKSKGMLEAIGGISYLTALQEGVPSVANLGFWIAILQEKQVLRRMIQVGTEIVTRAYDDTGKGVDGTVDWIEKHLFSIALSGKTVGIQPVKTLVSEAIGDIELLYQAQGRITGMATGFADFDKMTQGLQNGEMIVIAARPSVGKTSLVMNMIEHIAIEQKLPCGMFSLEMQARTLIRRMICSRARVNHRSIADGFLAERDFPKLTEAASAISTAPIYIDDDSSLNILQIRARARRMVDQYGIKMLGIDYLQLIQAAGRTDKRADAVQEISNGVKSIAKELSIPVVILAQLNRSMDKDKARRPVMADLRESGAIEQDADVVALLSNNRKDEDDDTDKDVKSVNLGIAKQRNGPTGNIALTFLKAYTRFESAARVSEDDVPQETQQRDWVKD